MRVRLMLAMMLGLSVAFSWRSDAAGTDGAWWSTLTNQQKLAFVAGFDDGVIHGYSLLGAALILVKPDFDPVYLRPIVEAEKKAERQIRRDFERPPSQIVAGLDAVYADYRNITIAVGEAIIVVVRSIGGSSDAKIAELLERKRREASR